MNHILVIGGTGTVGPKLFTFREVFAFATVPSHDRPFMQGEFLQIDAMLLQ
jgi:hypothetical protein